MSAMFRRLLVANRGEIACRVIATARRMGIATVAVFSDADRDARHVRLADTARPIGPAPARDSYLRIDRILEAARREGAEAIHPGYGFLSENAVFAEACAAAGIVFVGPPPGAIRAMGSKAEAKALMARSGVPLVPGYHGEDQAPALLLAEACRIGFPVLIKASAGGGGKGMRVVDGEAGFAEALEGARREAEASFGDGRVLIERYLRRPRHIEIQVFADAHGNALSLFERDCSVQRRHQKVLEEAPAPGMDPERRARMGAAAVAAARAVDYRGAGTVEFIVEPGGAFFFMEMNTRLQVEHPVTEMGTGLDLVEWQLRVAAGEALPLGADRLRLDGHAIEARIYAEDPSRGFLPSTGPLRHLRQPAPGEGVRVDTGVRQGDAITPHYDPMIAKLVVHGPDRAAALRRLSTALAAYEVVGVRTNLDLLRAVAADAEFAAGGVDTGFLDRRPELLAAPEAEAADEAAIWAAAALDALRADREALAAGPAAAADPFSPWAVGDAWRLNGAGWRDLVFERDGARHALRLHPRPGGEALLDLPGGGTVRAAAEWEEDGGLLLRLDGASRRLRVVPEADGVTVLLDGRARALRRIDPLAPPEHRAAAGERVASPIPARVSRVLVAPGEAVEAGAALLVVEAMKMELTLRAPAAGMVGRVLVAEGEMVEEGVELVVFRPGTKE